MKSEDSWEVIRDMYVGSPEDLRTLSVIGYLCGGIVSKDVIEHFEGRLQPAFGRGMRPELFPIDWDRIAALQFAAARELAADDD